MASRNAKMVCDEDRGVGETGLAVYLDFADAIKDFGRSTIEERYGNLFAMYEEITAEDLSAIEWMAENMFVVWIQFFTIQL